MKKVGETPFLLTLLSAILGPSYPRRNLYVDRPKLAGLREQQRKEAYVDQVDLGIRAIYPGCN